MYACTFWRLLRGEEGLIRRKVAELAGVSEATVSRVLSGAGTVKDDTAKRVMDAAKQLGYVPNALAQRFALRKSGNLGVILPLLPKVNLFSTFYFSEVLSGIGVTAKQRGYDLLLLFREADEARDYASLFRTQKIDGCIILGSKDTPGERAALAELKEREHPFCLVNQRFEGEAYNTVDADQKMGSRHAVRHLLRYGYRKICFLNGPPEYSNSLDRLNGFQQALAEAQVPFREEHVLIGNYSRKSGYRQTETVAALIRSGEVDAVIAANDRMAIGLMQGLKELGIRAGEDFALVGCDDSDVSSMMEPQLTSIRVPFYEVGCEAASRLLDLMTETEPSPPFEVKLPVKLIERASSKTTRSTAK
ncbi:LacI family DNA-binding transcriptional regulator [Paenibacillus montanisoli]|uniref:LacI family transcriptional regulator n=1 Tax=Paenibacillus montanisoli TaxID=2081970 RepID=A0A328U4I5_9BACL|nr:LacI family DNA-binding transcriptional regulator [Paenibacillus montanisoli]RAP76972.1 LacI family transcriptional regulator [Paenibacillus montanisoli]